MAEREGHQITTSIMDEVQAWSGSQPVAECYRREYLGQWTGGTGSHARPENPPITRATTRNRHAKAIEGDTE